MVTYDEHLEFLVKQEMGARAERTGFQMARQCKSALTYSSNEYEQRRYAQGFEDGHAMLMQEVPHADMPVLPATENRADVT